MQLFVKTLTGRTITTECEPGDTIFVLKQKISEKVQIPADKQGLTYGGKRLKNEMTIKYYNIQKESVLHLTWVYFGKTE